MRGVEGFSDRRADERVIQARRQPRHHLVTRLAHGREQSRARARTVAVGLVVSSILHQARDGRDSSARWELEEAQRRDGSCVR
jgi:hypothetical protein